VSCDVLADCTLLCPSSYKHAQICCCWYRPTDITHNFWYLLSNVFSLDIYLWPAWDTSLQHKSALYTQFVAWQQSDLGITLELHFSQYCSNAGWRQYRPTNWRPSLTQNIGLRLLQDRLATIERLNRQALLSLTTRNLQYKLMVLTSAERTGTLVGWMTCIVIKEGLPTYVK
jgi:hypothetical protein